MAQKRFSSPLKSTVKSIAATTGSAKWSLFSHFRLVWMKMKIRNHEAAACTSNKNNELWIFLVRNLFLLTQSPSTKSTRTVPLICKELWIRPGVISKLWIDFALMENQVLYPFQSVSEKFENKPAEKMNCSFHLYLLGEIQLTSKKNLE